MLADFDLRDPHSQVLGAKPVDLKKLSTQAVTSIITPEAVITMVAHQGESQDVADLLDSAIHYVQHGMAGGNMEDLAAYAINMDLEEIQDIITGQRAAQEEELPGANVEHN